VSSSISIMTNPERRYDEREIAAIFREAAETQEAEQVQQPPAEGLTLAELQEIGRETGIAPAQIARAAAAVDRRATAAPRSKLLGLPVGLERTIGLPGPLSNAAWDRLVADMCEVFQVHGEVQRDDAHRVWNTEDLQAFLEPTEAGYRLRIRTQKRSARGLLLGGLANLALGLAFLAVLVVNHDLQPFLDVLLALQIALGLGAIGVTAYRLPRWAKDRERQIDEVAARAVALAGLSHPAGTPVQAPALLRKEPTDDTRARAARRTRP
jgi:hypothetical protein